MHRGQGEALPPGRIVALGVLAALVFLARTDLFWLPLLVGLWLWRRTPARLRGASLYGAAVAALSAPYLLYNLLGHGHLMPISDRAKLFYCQLAHPTLASYLQSQEWHAAIRAFSRPVAGPGIETWIAALIGLLLLGLAVLSLTRRGGLGRRAVGLRLVGLALLLHLIFMHLVYRELRPVNAYYFAPAYVWAMLAVAAAVARRADSLPVRSGPRDRLSVRARATPLDPLTPRRPADLLELRVGRGAQLGTPRHAAVWGTTRGLADPRPRRAPGRRRGGRLVLAGPGSDHRPIAIRSRSPPRTRWAPAGEQRAGSRLVRLTPPPPADILLLFVFRALFAG